MPEKSTNSYSTSQKTDKRGDLTNKRAHEHAPTVEDPDARVARGMRHL